MGGKLNIVTHWDQKHKFRMTDGKFHIAATPCLWKFHVDRMEYRIPDAESNYNCT